MRPGVLSCQHNLWNIPYGSSNFMQMFFYFFIHEWTCMYTHFFMYFRFSFLDDWLSLIDNCWRTEFKHLTGIFRRPKPRRMFNFKKRKKILLSACVCVCFILRWKISYFSLEISTFRLYIKIGRLLGFSYSRPVWTVPSNVSKLHILN